MLNYSVAELRCIKITAKIKGKRNISKDVNKQSSLASLKVLSIIKLIYTKVRGNLSLYINTVINSYIVISLTSTSLTLFWNHSPFYGMSIH